MVKKNTPAGAGAMGNSEFLPPVSSTTNGSGPLSDLEPKDLQQLKDSGISDELIAERGYFTARRKVDLINLQFKGEQAELFPSLVIPIHNSAGLIETHQLRPDRPRQNKDGKEAKYETKAGTRMLLDVPPTVREQLKDPKIPIVITEGVKKADAAASRGICCIDLLGVWNWRGTNEHGGKTFLADFDDIALNGCEVYICFDSDVMEKPQVHAALVGQKAGLERRGASVQVIYLPPLANGKKCGLDDYLLDHSKEELFALATPEIREIVSAPRFPLITFAQLRALPEPKYQIEDFFLERSFVQAFGETGHGKSLLFWDLACNIAMGSETWFGKKINRHGPVVWINADGGAGLTKRANAWAAAHGAELKHPLLTLMGSVALNRRDQMDAFIEQILALDEPPVLTVFDTQSRCTTGVKENDADAMTLVTDGLHRLKLEVGCTVLPVHHTNKAGMWERGSGVVKNETDTQIRVTHDEKSGIFTVHCEKGRDHPEWPDFYFKLQRVENSVIIVAHDQAPPRNRSDVKEDKLEALLGAVAEWPGASAGYLMELLEINSTTTFYRYVGELRDALPALIFTGIAVNYGEEDWSTKRPVGYYPEPVGHEECSG